MKHLDTITVTHANEFKHIELYHGDLAALNHTDNVDLLVVSAFPNSYGAANPKTLIGALARNGVSVKVLARNKAHDMRAHFSCWVSEPVPDHFPQATFKRLLCFEPLARSLATEVVGDVFQSITSVVSMDNDIKTVAMPVLASGNQRADHIEMLAALVEAAVHWMSLGLPIDTIKIVHVLEQRALEAKGAFAMLKKQFSNFTLSPPQTFTYDFFISYSRHNLALVDHLMDVFSQQPNPPRVFLDRKDINPGVAWQQEIYDALEDCRKMIAFYSPAYIASKVCKEEFNIALFRHRETDGGVIVPLYVYSADLPIYMRMINFIDCREGDRDRLTAAAIRLVDELG